MIRIFVALPIPLPVATELAALVPAPLEGLKRVRPELLHVTLAFVGWLAEARVAEVTAAVREVASAGRPFRVDLTAVGRFPPSGRPRVVWAGIARPAAARTVELGGVVRASLETAGLPFDPKPLQPHITLARIRDDASVEQARAVASAVAAARVPEGLAFEVDGIDVMSSVLTRSGPRYSLVARAPLG